MTSPLEPACIITAEHSQIRGNHIPSSSLRITNDMRVTHTSGANGRRQYRLAIVKRNPTTRIVAIGKIHIDLFRIAVRIFDEMDEQVAEWAVCCGHDVTLLLISFVFRVACVRRVSKALRLGCEKGCRMTTAALRKEEGNEVLLIEKRVRTALCQRNEPANWRSALTAPSMTPLLKYFCRNGYTTSKGRVDTMMMPYLI